MGNSKIGNETSRKRLQSKRRPIFNLLLPLHGVPIYSGRYCIPSELPAQILNTSSGNNFFENKFGKNLFLLKLFK